MQKHQEFQESIAPTYTGLRNDSTSTSVASTKRSQNELLSFKEDFDLRILNDLYNLSPDHSDYEELVAVFIKNSAGRFANIMEAAKNRDFETFKALTHAMKGSCAAYGVRKLAQWSQQLEDSCEVLPEEGLMLEISSFGRHLVAAQEMLRNFNGLS